MNIAIPRAETNYSNPLISSPLFPLLYFSLYYSQRYVPRITDDILLKYDYIVVGAGSAGSTLATRLSEISCAKILLLEAGSSPPIISEIPGVDWFSYQGGIDWGYATPPLKRTGRFLNNRQFLYTRGKGLGGSSILNSMMYVRGSRHIYNKWEEQGAIGWSYRNILPYFKKMEMNRNFESVETNYHGFQGPMVIENVRSRSPYTYAINDAIIELGYSKVDSNGRNQKGFYNFQTNTNTGQRYSTAKAYLIPAENRTNLHIVDNAFVMKVIFSGDRAIGVQVKIRESILFIEASKEVILSAGAINTPQILMLSGIGPKSHLNEMGIPVLADLPVGLNAQDHLACFHAYYTYNLPTYESVYSSSKSILQYINKRTGPLTVPAGFQYTAFLTNDKYSPDDALPDYQLFFAEILLSTMAAWTNMNVSVYNEIFRPYQNASTFLCISQYLEPKSFGIVKLKSSNPLEHPIYDPNYFAHSSDLKTLMNGLKECDLILNTNAFKRLGVRRIETKYPGCEMYDVYSDEYLKCEIESLPLAIYHVSGTAKMGDPSDPTTVLDPKLRVKGFHGLRVVDASVMPVIPSGNTNNPTIMVAEKAADMIKEDIQCET